MCSKARVPVKGTFPTNTHVDQFIHVYFRNCSIYSLIHLFISPEKRLLFEDIDYLTLIFHNIGQVIPKSTLLQF